MSDYEFEQPESEDFVDDVDVEVEDTGDMEVLALAHHEVVEVTVMPKGVHPLYTIVVRVEDGVPVAYLLDREVLDIPAGIREVDADLLARAAVGYDFTADIQAVFPSPADIALAMYRRGIVDKETLAERGLLEKAVTRVFVQFANDLRALLGEQNA